MRCIRATASRSTWATPRPNTTSACKHLAPASCIDAASPRFACSSKKMRISSTDNPIYRRLKQLATSARACRDARRTLIEGVHLLQAALDARATIRTLVLRGAEQSADALALVPRAEAQSKAKVIELAPALYDAISPVEHGAGVLAEIEFDE